jgi:hypothetical protein
MAKVWSVGLLVAALPGIAAAADVAGTRAAIDRSLDTQYPHLKAVYEDIHIHPELGFQEARTAAKLAGEMKALGPIVYVRDHHIRPDEPSGRERRAFRRAFA